MLKLVFCNTLFLAYSMIGFAQQNENIVYEVKSGEVIFESIAPLETITASSSEIKGLINFSDNSFAILIEMKSFNGFNSPLQQEHFNENYVESDIYPKATYKGKIIEPVNLQLMGETTIRTKGSLIIHGIEKQQIIPAKLFITENNVKIVSKFVVSLSDYTIEIPRIVRNKISENIQVSVNAELVPYKQLQN